MVSNITIFGLNNNFAKAVGKLISDELDMFFADVMELLKFDFINLVDAENVVGRDYLLKQERTKIKTLASYENTVICCDFRSLNSKENYDRLDEGSVMIYLKLNDKSLKKVDAEFKPDSDYDLFSDITIEYLENKAEIVCDVSDMDVNKAANTVLNSLMKYYKENGVK